MRENAKFDRLASAVLLTLVFLVLWTFRDYGASWDEHAQHEYGEKVVRYYTSLFKDRSAIFMPSLQNYGGFFEVVAVLFSWIAPFGLYESRHLLTALTGISGIFASWRLVHFIAGSGAAFWTVLLLALYPPYYGHMFINSKDVPFATFHIIALYCLVRLISEFPDIRWQTAAKAGLAIGLTMAIRVGGLVLLCYLALILVVFLAARPASFCRSVIVLGTVALIAYAVMLPLWPYALSKPWIHAFDALESLSRIQPAFSPRTYVSKFLLLKLPEPVLALLIGGTLWGTSLLFRGGGWKNPSKTSSCLLLALAVLFPIAYAAVTRPFLYDEIRHFLFIIPLLFCFAGMTLNQALEWSRRKPGLRGTVLAALFLYLTLLARFMMQLHPYEYAYYNRFAGGVSGAYQKGYEPEYWATSYKEGVAALKSYFARRDGAAFETNKYRIAVGPAEWCATPYFPENFLFVVDAQNADAILSTTRNKAADQYEGQEIIAVGRFDATFMVGKIPRRQSPKRGTTGS